VILFRCFPWDADTGERTRGGPLWFPRMAQGEGRHDNPTAYGCLYVSEEPVSAVVERLAPFRGWHALEPWMLVSRGRTVALAALELSDNAVVLDLDEPAVLQREELRPSRVATGERAITQEYASTLYLRHADAAGLRWWSTFESLWANVTVFDRAEGALRAEEVQPLAVGDDVVRGAAEFLGLPIST
jgi:RES domain